MEGETCRVCGGDGRIGNSLGRSSTTCPGCHGSGRRAEGQSRFRDVTKTKQSHYAPQERHAVVTPAGPKTPTTPEGVQLASEVAASGVAEDAKKRIIGEIMLHESTHGRCTQTFLKKVKKQIKPGAG